MGGGGGSATLQPVAWHMLRGYDKRRIIQTNTVNVQLWNKCTTAMQTSNNNSDIFCDLRLIGSIVCGSSAFDDLKLKKKEELSYALNIWIGTCTRQENTHI